MDNLAAWALMGSAGLLLMLVYGLAAAVVAIWNAVERWREWRRLTRGRVRGEA